MADAISMTGFEHSHYDLGPAALQPLAAENVELLGKALAAIPPWSIIGWSAEHLSRAFQRELPSVRRFEVLSGGELAGIVTIQDPFLHGPYLQLLAILPSFQGRNLGLHILQWMESEARIGKARQLWLCVSTFNDRARAFYELFGFEAVTVLEKLASSASDELLMRKRLSY
jgi:ribosomal protein S18 acetylase RimI-like enzyme